MNLDRFKKLKKPAMQAELQKHNLSTDGTKAQLVQTYTVWYNTKPVSTYTHEKHFWGLQDPSLRGQ
jgi:hypothetical protein